jgi:hypothetical protein
MPNVVSMIEEMLTKAERKASSENRKLEEALRRLNEAMGAHGYANKEHGIDPTPIQMVSNLKSAAKCAENAQNAVDKVEVIMVIAAMASTMMKERPELKNYSGVGRWREDWECEGEEGEVRCGAFDWKVGMRERFLRLSTYPAHKRGLFDYLLNNRR